MKLTREQITELQDAFNSLLKETGNDRGFGALCISAAWNDRTNEVAIFMSADDQPDQGMRILKTFIGKAGCDAADAFIKAGGCSVDGSVFITPSDFDSPSTKVECKCPVCGRAVTMHFHPPDSQNAREMLARPPAERKSFCRWCFEVLYEQLDLMEYIKVEKQLLGRESRLS